MVTFLVSSKGKRTNWQSGTDEQEAGGYEAGRVDSIAAKAEDMSRRVGSAVVGRHGGPDRRAWLAESAGRLEWRGARWAGSASFLGRLGHGWPGQLAWWAWSAGMAGRMGLGGQAGLGRDRPGGGVGAGRVGQERAGPGRSSCERANVWFLETCVRSKLARWIKLATILEPPQF